MVIIDAPGKLKSLISLDSPSDIEKLSKVMGNLYNHIAAVMLIVKLH